MSKKRKHRSRFNKHHLTPKSRGGNRSHENLLRIDIEKHAAWHKVFGNRTLDEIIRLLIRLKNLKRGIIHSTLFEARNRCE